MMRLKVRIRFPGKVRIILPRGTTKVLNWSRVLLFVLGIAALGYVGYALADAQLYQTLETWRFEQELKAADSAGAAAGNPSSNSVVLAKADQSGTGLIRPAGRRSSALGRLEIPRLGVAIMILEGSDEGTLRRGAGHIPATPLPGQPGNTVIVAHRDTFFRGLRRIRKDDEIKVTTRRGIYRYRVDSTQIVSPDDTDVLIDSSAPTLTLLTCYPFNYVGSAPNRFVVRAHRSRG